MSSLMNRLTAQRPRLQRIATALAFNVVLLAANMVTGIITARALDPVGRGELLSISIWPQIVATALTFGMPAALVYELQRRISPAGQVYAAASAIGVAAALLGSVLAALLLPLLLHDRSAHLIAFAQIYLLMTPVVSLSLVTTSLFQGLEDFRAFNLIRVLMPLLTIAFLLAVHGTVGLDVESATLSYAAAGIVAAGVGLRLAFRRLDLSRAALRTQAGQVFRRLATFGRGHAGTDIFAAVEANLDKVILVKLLTPADLGLYAVAYGSARVILAAASAVAAVEFPRAAALAPTDALRAMARAAALSAAVSLPALVVGVTFAGSLLQLVYGAAFVKAAPLFSIFLFEGFCSGLVLVLIHAFLAAGRPVVGSRIQVAGTLLTAAALLIGVQYAGAVGAALGAALVAFIKLSLLGAALWKETRP